MPSNEPKTIILGAGASRGVSYAQGMKTLSPLDTDFFDLLQRLETKDKQDAKAITFVVQQALEAPGDQLWTSMERLFYTRHLNAVMRHKLILANDSPDPAKELLRNFARAIQALLRAAHGKEVCFHHDRVFQRLAGQDAILTFNYDLVAERALRKHLGIPEFGPWLYGFEVSPDRTVDVPLLHKLHGSVNWRSTTKGRFPEVRQKSWADFDEKPGYADFAPPFSILLPYWEKRVEEPPWLSIWRAAAGHLMETTSLIIWGYSLPLTDLKARELLRATLSSGANLKHVAVIDPSERVREKWRGEFVKQKFWQYKDIEDFLVNPPAWYRPAR